MGEFMDDRLAQFIDRLRCGSEVNPETVAEVLSSVRFPVDPSFTEFIKHCNGAEGFLSPDQFILFWKTEDLLQLNPYSVKIEQSHGLFFFGSDGSDFGFAFDQTNGKVVGIDLIDLGQVEPKTLANSFTDFIGNLRHNPPEATNL